MEKCDFNRIFFQTQKNYSGNDNHMAFNCTSMIKCIIKICFIFLLYVLYDFYHFLKIILFSCDILFFTLKLNNK